MNEWYLNGSGLLVQSAQQWSQNHGVSSSGGASTVAWPWQLLGLDFLNSLFELFFCPLWHFVVICIFAVFVLNPAHALHACKQRWGLHAYIRLLCYPLISNENLITVGPLQLDILFVGASPSHLMVGRSAKNVNKSISYTSLSVLLNHFHVFPVCGSPKYKISNAENTIQCHKTENTERLGRLAELRGCLVKGLLPSGLQKKRIGRTVWNFRCSLRTRSTRELLLQGLR